MKTQDPSSERGRGRVIGYRFARDVLPSPPDPAGGQAIVQPDGLCGTRQYVTDSDRIVR